MPETETPTIPAGRAVLAANRSDQHCIALTTGDLRNQQIDFLTEGDKLVAELSQHMQRRSDSRVERARQEPDR
jgi:hypothetical protein